MHAGEIVEHEAEGHRRVVLDLLAERVRQACEPRMHTRIVRFWRSLDVEMCFGFGTPETIFGSQARHAAGLLLDLWVRARTHRAVSALFLLRH